MFSHFDRIPACDRRTDRQTDILPQHNPHYVHARRAVKITLHKFQVDLSLPTINNIQLTVHSD